MFRHEVMPGNSLWSNTQGQCFPGARLAGGHLSLQTSRSPEWYRWGRQPMPGEQLSCDWGCERCIQTVS